MVCTFSIPTCTKIPPIGLAAPNSSDYSRCVSLEPYPADGSHRRSQTLDAAQPYQPDGLFSRLNSTCDSALHRG